METPVDFLFVYGTLRSGGAHPMAELLASCSEPAGAGTVAGRLYDFGAYPGAILDEHETGLVRGELFALHPGTAERLLRQLDRYEGAEPSAAGSALFRRVRVPVTLDTGVRIGAWVYVYAQPVDNAPRVSGGEYPRR